nr:DUF4834 family protein [uncultured Bacteroides sp.]
MGAIFSLFFFIIIIVLVFGLSIISGILRLLFGFGRKSHTRSYNFGGGDQTSNTHSDTSSGAASDSKSKHKKIFDKDDGEYVEFEELKEDK